MRLEDKFKKLEKQFKEQKQLYETAQYMLMEQVIKFVDDKEYMKLKQFCYNYTNRNI